MTRFRPFHWMSLALLLGMSACGPGRDSDEVKVDAAEQRYLAPPSATDVIATSAGLQLVGLATPSAKVRLASPAGETINGVADAKGVWRLGVKRIAPAAIYGLSQVVDGRTTQSEGYLLVTQAGQAVALRAGAGAVVLSGAASHRLTAVDTDRDGGAVVSGRGTRGDRVGAYVDGRDMGEARVDAAGRFSISLTGPISQGRHVIKVFGDSLSENLTLTLGPAAPLQAGPMRALEVPGALRVEWMTPGGGVQTTYVLNPVQGAVSP